MNKKFYSSFFGRNSFLSHDQTSIYAQHEYLYSLGFQNTEKFDGKVVLELGAGEGRLTKSLFELGAIHKSKKYIIVEPSAGIEVIKELIPNSNNLSFLKCELGELHSKIPFESVDYIIASGVIPHIHSENLENILSTISKFLKANGELHINSSFYGFDKSLSQRLKQASNNNYILSNLFAAKTVFLQKICMHGTNINKKWYHSNFVYSFQKGIAKQFKQQLEYYHVSPYNIQYSVKRYIKAARMAGLYSKEIYPHPVSILLTKENHKCHFELETASKKIVLIGNDWLTQYVRSLFNHLTIESNGTKPDTERHVVMLAYDYTDGPPYYRVIKEFEKVGFLYGQNLFNFQDLME